MSSTDVSPIVEIQADQFVNVVAFTPDGEYLVGGGYRSVRVWRVQDGRQIETMETNAWVYSIALSNDGKFIAAGTSMGKVFVWDAKTYKQVFEHKEGTYITRAVDFSPDSSCLVASPDRYSIVRDIANGKRVVFTLNHDHVVLAARYSPEGYQLATATKKSVRVWDSRNGTLLVKFAVDVVPVLNKGLIWFNSRLLVVSASTIQQFDASTRSAVSELPVPDTKYFSCIALHRQGKIIAYSSSDTITFWDSSTHTQLFLIQQYHGIQSIAFSLDDQFLAIATENKRITITRPSHSIDSILLSTSCPTLQEVDFRIDDVVYESWKNDRLTQAEASLTAAIAESRGTIHHVFATRALVRTRLGQGDTAIVDAEKSIEIQPSLIGYVAKFVALVGGGKILEAFRACDIALQLFHTTHASTLLLIKAVTLFMVGEHDDAISRIDDLIKVVPLDSPFCLVKTYMCLVLGGNDMNAGNYDRAIEFFQLGETQLRCRKIQPPPLIVSLISGWKFDRLRTTLRKYLCEAFYLAGRINEASEAILETVNKFHDEILPITKWVTAFMELCLSTAESNDAANDSTPLLVAWAQFKLTETAWEDIVAAAVGFMHPRRAIYRVICGHLESIGRMQDAVACFHRMIRELPEEVEPMKSWITDFKLRCDWKLKTQGETAMNVRWYDKAISLFTTALSLHPTAPQDLLVRRSEAYLESGSWDDALNDAHKLIKLDSSSPLGYEVKHAALLGAGRHSEAIDAFELMLSTMSQSSDPEVRDRSTRYVAPAETKKVIRAAVAKAIQDSPPELINTHSGRLLNKSAQALSFESESVFVELISSTTTEIDHARIEREVAQHYRYATFSHKWQDNEPLFDKVANVVVYDLEAIPTHNKLQMFCKIVREAGFNWAWSDTCCINKGDHFVLQEALVSMFKWYQGSAMTIVFLLGINRLSQWGDLTKSVWNTRAWTLQEYHASKVVQFYTEDWTPYMDLDMHNHKDSPRIIAEMERATGVSVQALVSLCPGLGDVREKLRLASMRETARIEDAAYSLLGIFGISLPITYGEGNQALGRLLAQLLTSSGDTSILAWTGQSGNFNSCLPSNIVVFREFSTSHIPPAATRDEMDATTTVLRASSLNVRLITELYNRLSDLPVPSFSGQRMRLPCLYFKLGPVSRSRSGTEQVFRAQTAALGVVEIKTEEDLSRLGTLYLVHPWIDFLLDRQPIGSIPETTTEVEGMDDKSSLPGELPAFPAPFGAGSQPRAAQLIARLGRPFSVRRSSSVQETASLQPPSTVSPVEKQTRALDFVARLRRPFGALLVTPIRRNVEEYRRVAPEALVTVQVHEMTPEVLKKLMESVRVLDVL